MRFPRFDFDEHMLVELRDGRLWMLARTLDGIAESHSSDHGGSWTPPHVRFPHINARFHIRRLASGRLLLVKHGRIDQRTPQRSHLTAFLSEDDGQTWRGDLVLDERPGISYPDGFQAPDGTLFIIYDRNRYTDAEILLARFRESDVLAAAFAPPAPSPASSSTRPGVARRHHRHPHTRPDAVKMIKMITCAQGELITLTETAQFPPGAAGNSGRVAQKTERRLPHPPTAWASPSRVSRLSPRPMDICHEKGTKALHVIAL